MTATTRLRVARVSDAARIREIYAPFVADTATSFETEVPDVAEMARRIERVLERHLWLVAETVGDDGPKIVGYAYSTPHRARAAYRWTIETTVYVEPAFARRGIARALYDALLTISTRQGYRRAIAILTLPNDASQGFHAALGFELVGRFEDVGFKRGRWHSTECRAMTLVDASDPPQEPQAWDRAVASDELEATLAAASRRTG